MDPLVVHRGPRHHSLGSTDLGQHVNIPLHRATRAIYQELIKIVNIICVMSLLNDGIIFTEDGAHLYSVDNEISDNKSILRIFIFEDAGPTSVVTKEKKVQ